LSYGRVLRIVMEGADAWRISLRIGAIQALRVRARGAHNQDASSRMSP